jgi:hypothetical protein
VAKEKTYETIVGLSENQVAKTLLDFTVNSNLHKKIEGRNRGGPLENVFNEAEILSAAGLVAQRVVAKVSEYRGEVAANPKLRQKKFEHLPLVIRYYETALENYLKDIANAAGAQKRAKGTEVLQPQGHDEVNFDEIHGTLDVVVAREKKDLLDQAAFNLARGSAALSARDQELILSAFRLMFVLRVETAEDLARELGIRVDEAAKVRGQMIELLKAHCKPETGEYLYLINNSKSALELGQESAQAARRAASASPRQEAGRAMSTGCEASTAVAYKAVGGKVCVTVSVLVLRDAGQVKEIERVVKEFRATCPDMAAAQDFRKTIQLDVKRAEAVARDACRAISAAAAIAIRDAA